MLLYLDGNPQISTAVCWDRTDDLNRSLKSPKPKIYCSVDSFCVECARARTGIRGKIYLAGRMLKVVHDLIRRLYWNCEMAENA